MSLTDLPVSELILRAAVVYGVLLLLMRLSGRRTVGQFTPFDLLVVMLISEGASNSLVGDDHSVGGGLIVGATLLVLNAIAGLLATHSQRAQKLLEGVPILIARDGVAFTRVLKRHRISEGEFEQALRAKDCELAEVDAAYLEPDGSISVRTRA